MDIKAQYDEEAKIYEQTSRAVNIYCDEALNFLINSIKSPTEKPSVLDICCGTGMLTEKFLNEYPKSSAVGVDFSKNMLAVANERLKNFDFKSYCFDISDTKEFKDLPKFDLAISSYGIHNVHGYENKKHVFKNIFGQLKDGGEFITCDLLKGKNAKEQAEYDKIQSDFIRRSYSEDETNEWMKLLGEEDKPETWVDYQKMMRELSTTAELLWKKDFLAVWKAAKPLCELNIADK